MCLTGHAGVSWQRSSHGQLRYPPQRIALDCQVLSHQSCHKARCSAMQEILSLHGSASLPVCSLMFFSASSAFVQLFGGSSAGSLFFLSVSDPLSRPSELSPQICLSLFPMKIYRKKKREGKPQLIGSYNLRLDVFSVDHVHESFTRRHSLFFVIFSMSGKLDDLQDLVWDYSQKQHPESLVGALNLETFETYF